MGARVGGLGSNPVWQASCLCTEIAFQFSAPYCAASQKEKQLYPPFFFFLAEMTQKGQMKFQPNLLNKYLQSSEQPWNATGERWLFCKVLST